MNPEFAAKPEIAAVLNVMNSLELNADLTVIAVPVPDIFEESHPPKLATVAKLAPEVDKDPKFALTLAPSLATVLIWSLTFPEVKMLCTPVRPATIKTAKMATAIANSTKV